MRKLNAVLSMLILVLFILHAVFGSFQILGIGNTALKLLAWVSVCLIIVHTVIGIKLTWDTLRIQKKNGVSYFKENKLFWIRRISGFAVMVLLFFHITAFGHTSNGFYRLHNFNAAKLTSQILLVASVGVHILSNVKPIMLAFGIRSFKHWIYDILIVLSFVLLFMAIALVVYYMRWSA